MSSITVTLHDGDLPLQRVTVNVTDAVQTLHGLVPGGGRRLVIFRGSLLMAAFSFRHHGIKDGDDLYIVRPASRPRIRPDRPARRPRALQWGHGLMRGGGTLLMEASRLADLACATSQIRSDPPSPPEPHGRARPQQPWKTVLDGPREAGGPSTEPLPVWWR
jgi:hypothetical protein